MKLAVMQPYFFPYIGYYHLIHSCDRFVVLDTVQYLKGAWHNRNRIIGQDGNPAYITAHIKKTPSETLLKDVLADDSGKWKRKIKGMLTKYSKAAYYREASEIVHQVLDCEYERLIDYSMKSLELTAEYIGLKFKPERLSEMNLPLPEIHAPGEWSLNIAEILKADEYINTPMGARIFDEDEFIKRGIKLSFIDPFKGIYSQGGATFIPNLSIVDVIMWNSPEECRNIASNYRLMDKKSIMEIWK